MEWKYAGQFKDRSPNIRAAGAPLEKCGTMKDLLKIYPIDDAIVTVLTEAGLHKVPIDNPLPKLTSFRHPGVYTGSKALVNPPVETRYQTLLRDLRETTWDSYWNKNVGKCRDSSARLPYDKLDKTFGKLRTRDNPTGEELMNPDISPYELAFNEAEYHKMYSKTHNDYYPGEKHNREYSPPFEPTQRYGSIPRRKKTVACSMEMENQQPLTLANNILADFIDRNKPKLGKPFAPNQNIKCVAPGHRFGDESIRVFYSLPELIQPDLQNSNFRRDFRVWLQSVIEMRKAFKKRNVNFKELLGYCTYADFNDSQWISLNVFQRILADKNLVFPHHEVLPFAECFGMYRDGMVRYKAMIDLFNISVQIPDLQRIDDNNTDASGNYVTSYLFERCNALVKDNSKHPPAGVKTYRNDSMSAILAPSVLTNYGLSHTDLLAPREPEYIKSLFEKLGYQFPDNTFEKLWKMGQDLDRNTNVCADTFRQIMEQAAPIIIKPEAEDNCFQHETIKHCPDKRN